MYLSVQLTGFAAIALATIAFFVYRALLPKPIAGIPYSKKSAARLLGDVPDVLQHNAETAEMLSFLEKRCRELGSPICQVFVRPFSRPWVVVADGREATDIMSRRGREFDRSAFIKDILDTTFPHSMVSMPTNEQWRSNRRLVADTMSASFLNVVGASAVHEQTLSFIETLRLKARLAQGSAFDVKQDIAMCTLDTIWSTAFGTSLGATQAQSNFLESLQTIPTPNTERELVDFPQGQLPEAYYAILAIIKSSEIPLKSPFGFLHHWLAIKLYPSLRRAMCIRQTLVGQKFEQAWQTFGSEDDKESDRIKCAVDLIVQQEVKAAHRHGRKPDTESKYLVGEMNAFLGAGFETTSSVVSWGLKYLTAHQDVQAKLRRELHKTFHECSGDPASHDLAKANLPYLDGFMDEVLRHSCITPSNNRRATIDTTIMGYYIPKGTDVFMLNNGPSVVSAPFPMNSNKSLDHGNDPKWSHTDLDIFRPDRFLTSTGQYDPNAAPNLSFGLGVRACFGKRLAMMEMKIMYALIIWNFELLPLDEALVDWKAIDVIAHQPRRTVVRLREVTT